MKNLNKQVIADCIYANRDLITDSSIDTTSVETLMLLTKAQLIDIATAYELNPVVTTNVFDNVLQEQGIQTHLAKDGTAYTTISLPLTETNGLKFKFAYLDGQVSVSEDIHLYRAYKGGFLNIGDSLEFNFSGPQDFKLLNPQAKIYVANNSIEFPSAGLLNKAVSIFLMKSVEKNTERKDELAMIAVETADENGISIRQAKMLIKDLNAKRINETLVARLAKLTK